MGSMFCQCGCGELAPIAAQKIKRLGLAKGDAYRYIAGHGRRGRNFRPLNDRSCACGCGRSVNPRNPAARYVQGHQLPDTRAARTWPDRRGPHPCECGCGELAKPKARFVGHHGNRGVKRGEGRYVNSQGYVLLRMPDHPQAHAGYVLEHRWVMEQTLSRPLQPDEVVHHINHIKTDNRRENLALMSQHHHGKQHGRPKRTPVSAQRRAQISRDMTRVWAERKTTRE